MTLPVEYVREELAFVDVLLSINVPDHLALALHLCVTEVANVVTAIWPLEFTIALHLRVDELSAVQILLGDLLHLIRIELAFLLLVFLPLLDAFALDLPLWVEVAAQLNGTIVADFDSFALVSVQFPLSIVLRAVTRLLELTLATKHPIGEAADVCAPVWENLRSYSFRLVIDEVSLEDGAVGEGQLAVALLPAILPFAFIAGAILPLDDGISVHLTAFPVAAVAPALLPADKDAVALLIALEVIAFIRVAVLPEADAFAPGKTVPEFTFERLIAAAEDKQPLSVHTAFDPLALIPLAIWPLLDAEAVR